MEPTNINAGFWLFAIGLKPAACNNFLFPSRSRTLCGKKNFAICQMNLSTLLLFPFPDAIDQPTDHWNQQGGTNILPIIARKDQHASWPSDFYVNRLVECSYCPRSLLSVEHNFRVNGKM